MKTIKELEAFERENFNKLHDCKYKEIKALKDVLGLIDELRGQNCSYIESCDDSCDSIDPVELKKRIEG